MDIDPEVAKYAGCLIGGAVGDALGAPIEFKSTAQIRSRFGPKGVQDYVERPDGMGAFTDDTQMTLFTAEGILRAKQRAELKGIAGAELAIIYQSYLRWLHTQGRHPREIPPGMGVYDVDSGWLVKERGLHVQRAPGLTCLGALESGWYGTVDLPINNSKGCGGVMRVAPVGLIGYENPDLAFKTSADAAALTHGHPSGYLSAGTLGSLIAYLVQGDDLPTAVERSIEILMEWPKHEECLSAVEKALGMYQNSSPTPETIERLGRGWVGEEALAISLFCALNYQDDFAGGVLTAINHSGDSDSTGAITGNILGALLGVEGIPPTWIEHLELIEVVRQIALDLEVGVNRHLHENVDEWVTKYPPF